MTSLRPPSHHRAPRSDGPAPPRNLSPTVRPVLADGRPAVFVSLSGHRAAGASMLLDPADWEWVRDEVTPCWVLAGSHPWYVMSTSKAAAAFSGRWAGFPSALLARVLMERHGEDLTGKAVVYRSGDRKDLRRANLLTLARAEARVYQPDGLPPKILRPH